MVLISQLRPELTLVPNDLLAATAGVDLFEILYASEELEGLISKAVLTEILSLPYLLMICWGNCPSTRVDSIFLRSIWLCLDSCSLSMRKLACMSVKSVSICLLRMVPDPREERLSLEMLFTILILFGISGLAERLLFRDLGGVFGVLGVI